MRTLLVLRHAKAATPFGVADFDRPLNQRGRHDAAAAGTWLNETGLRPDRVLCSPARRTRETWERLRLPTDAEVDFDPRIYSAEAETLRELVGETADQVRTLLLIGHNPAVHRLVFDLTGGASESFPTTALAVVRIAEEQAAGWSDLRPGAGRLETLHTPKG